MELVIASNNAGKIGEIRQMVTDIELLSLKDIGFNIDIPEPFHTFEENALAKASVIHQYCGKNVFADDSGLCVNALHGAPGLTAPIIPDNGMMSKTCRKYFLNLK